MTYIELLRKVYGKNNQAIYDRLNMFLPLYIYQKTDDTFTSDKEIFDIINKKITRFYDTDVVVISTTTSFWFKFFVNFYPDKERFFTIEPDKFSFYCKSTTTGNYGNIEIKDNEYIPLHVLETLLEISDYTELACIDECKMFKVIKTLHSFKSCKYKICTDENQILSYILEDSNILPQDKNKYRKSIKRFIEGKEPNYIISDIDIMIIRL